jgi:hypothetical protein
MATVTPPIRNDISGTAPNPSNAVARTAFGVLHDYLMNLLGSAGTPAAARTALDIKQLQSIDYTLSGSALTLKLNPTNLDFRSTTLTTGAPTNIANAAQITTTISSGSTAGTTNGVQSDIILLAINNAGTMELAWVNAAGGVNLDEQGVITTVAEGGAGAADSATTIYSTTARTGVAYRVVGLFRSTQTTAGTWAQTPTLVQGIGGLSLGNLSQKLTSGTKVNTTSGTSVDFTGIPSGTKRITLSFSGVSMAGTETMVVQLGDSGGAETSGYLGAAGNALPGGGGGAGTRFTTNFPLYPAAITAAATLHGSMILTLLDAATNLWSAQWNIGFSDADTAAWGAGSKATSTTLDRVRLTTSGGATAFDAGSMNILYE